MIKVTDKRYGIEVRVKGTGYRNGKKYYEEVWEKGNGKKWGLKELVRGKGKIYG